MYYDALSNAETVLQRLKCINRTLSEQPLKGDPLSPEVRAAVNAALMEHQLRCEEVIPFPVDYDPNQYPLQFPLGLTRKQPPN